MAEKVTEKASTEYTILKCVDVEDNNWTPIGVQSASGPETAVKTFLNTGSNGDEYGEGNYRGVAKRSWGDPVLIAKKISFG